MLTLEIVFIIVAESFSRHAMEQQEQISVAPGENADFWRYVCIETSQNDVLLLQDILLLIYLTAKVLNIRHM
jgi:hypothetical protein